MCIYGKCIRHENKTCGKHITTQAHMEILHSVYHTHQLSSPNTFGWMWTNKNKKLLIYLQDLFKTWWGRWWLVSIEWAHIHSDTQNATKLQSRFIQMCWSNLILSFPMVWWESHNCFEISIGKTFKSWRNVCKRHKCLSLMTIIIKKRFQRTKLNNSSNKIYIYYDHWIN